MLTMIRRYRDKDSEALIEIWYTASQVATRFLSEEFLAEEREAIRKSYLPSAETWVFETEGTVAGFITLLGNEVGAIFVHPKWQRRGVGRALMDHAIDLRSFLHLDVFKENAVDAWRERTPSPRLGGKPLRSRRESLRFPEREGHDTVSLDPRCETEVASAPG